MASPQGTRDSILSRIDEGMDVYSGDDKIGTVRTVFFGERGDVEEQSPAERANATAQSSGDSPSSLSTLATEFARIFDGDELDETIRQRLLDHGFIRIDSGLLGSDKFAMREQISSVNDGNVRLNADEDDLISR